MHRIACGCCNPAKYLRSLLAVGDGCARSPTESLQLAGSLGQSRILGRPRCGDRYGMRWQVQGLRSPMAGIEGRHDWRLCWTARYLCKFKVGITQIQGEENLRRTRQHCDLPASPVPVGLGDASRADSIRVPRDGAPPIEQTRRKCEKSD